MIQSRLRESRDKWKVANIGYINNKVFVAAFSLKKSPELPKESGEK